MIGITLVAGVFLSATMKALDTSDILDDVRPIVPEPLDCLGTEADLG